MPNYKKAIWDVVDGMLDDLETGRRTQKDVLIRELADSDPYIKHSTGQYTCGSCKQSSFYTGYEDGEFEKFPHKKCLWKKAQELRDDSSR